MRLVVAALTRVSSVFLGVVTGFDEFGIPQVDFVEVMADRGNRNRGEEIVAAICAEPTDS